MSGDGDERPEIEVVDEHDDVFMPKRTRRPIPGMKFRAVHEPEPERWRDTVDWQVARVWIAVYLLIGFFWGLVGWCVWRLVR